VLRIESIDSAYAEGMTITGTLTNSATGVLNANFGAGSYPTLITGALINNGTINQPVGSHATGNIDGTGSITMGPSTNLTANRIRQASFSTESTVYIAPNGTDAGTSVVDSLSLIGSAAALDLANNAMIVNYSGSSPISTIQGWLTSGYNFGTWYGSSGIRSISANQEPMQKTALGFAEATDILGTFPAIFAGQSIDADSILVRYTLYGDANLNKAVDTIDFNLLASAFSQSPKRWSDGDFNYDTTVDTVDFNLLASRFSQILPAPVAHPAGAVVVKSLFSVQDIRDSLIDEL
jgi:hypothetical protein